MKQIAILKNCAKQNCVVQNCIQQKHLIPFPQMNKLQIKKQKPIVKSAKL